MITAERISKNYGAVQAVEDISFEVKEGENLVLLGTSGCGKTTTLKMINRLIPLTKGHITVNGRDINELRGEDLRRNIGYVLQHNSLFPHYTVAENIAVVPELLKWEKSKIRLRTEELLYKVHLPPGAYLSAYPNQLSGGQQQRVNIARALAADPPILLMDEPFGALDTLTRAAIAKEFSEIDEFMRKTIVLVTHDVREAFLLGDHICLMNEGRIVQQGKPAELLFRPANDFVKEFFSGSYLQLALEAVKVSDVWDGPGIPGIEDEAKLALPGNASVWMLMEESIKEKEKDHINVRSKDGLILTIKKKDIFNVLERI